jgi:hypothetical protein
VRWQPCGAERRNAEAVRELKLSGSAADGDHVAGSAETSEAGLSLRVRQEAARRRAECLQGITLRQRSGRYWLDSVEGSVVSISPSMALDELERQLTRLAKDHVDGCQG